MKENLSFFVIEMANYQTDEGEKAIQLSKLNIFQWYIRVCCLLRNIKLYRMSSVAMLKVCVSALRAAKGPCSAGSDSRRLGS